MKFQKPIGLFLCGGGALGSWQSGCLSELVNSGMDFDIIAGFSVGALNGAAYCFGKTSETIDIWKTISSKKILKFKIDYHNLPMELYRLHFGNFFWKASLKLNNFLSKFSLFSDKPLYDLVHSWIKSESTGFSKNCVFYVISHCIERKLPYFVKFKDSIKTSGISFLDAVVSSCSIPMVFPPVEIQEQEGIKIHLVDGGVIGNATINLNIFEGCRTIIIISNSVVEDLSLPIKGPFSYLESNARKILAIHVQKVYESRVFLRTNPDVYLLKPLKPLGLGILEFEDAKCSAAYNAGREQAYKWIKEQNIKDRI
jgi:predicted acylesterase/phospholipase RssA